jgi:hypothetical protein
LARFGSVFFLVFCRFRFGFFKNLIGLIGFFFSVRFFLLFFFWFSQFNRFSGFFAHSYWEGLFSSVCAIDLPACVPLATF